MEERSLDVDAFVASSSQGTPSLDATEECSPCCDAVRLLTYSFEDIHGYDGIVLLRGIAVRLHGGVEMQGVVHVAYLPDRRVVGISKLARLVDANACHCQSQERLTVRIAGDIASVLRPRGVGVVVEMAHGGLHGSSLGGSLGGPLVTTSRMLGAFRTDPDLRGEFRSLIRCWKAVDRIR